MVECCRKEFFTTALAYCVSRRGARWGIYAYEIEPAEWRCVRVLDEPNLPQIAPQECCLIPWDEYSDVD
jgi:hypothetical protein